MDKVIKVQIQGVDVMYAFPLCIVPSLFGKCLINVPRPFKTQSNGADAS